MLSFVVACFLFLKCITNLCVRRYGTLEAAGAQSSPVKLSLGTLSYKSRLTRPGVAREIGPAKQSSCMGHCLP